MTDTIDMGRSQDDDTAARRRRDMKRLRSIAVRHGAAALAALTLWGAADAWASDSGLMLAQLVALFNALFAGTALAYLAHEWGHFSGARLSGAISPVLKEPTSFFMFNFRDDLNSRSQFLAMSAGGPIANWSLFLLLFLLLPLTTLPQVLLVATSLAIAVSVSVFEVPVINRVTYGDDPAETVARRVREAGRFPRNTGIVAGAVFFLLFA